MNFTTLDFILIIVILIFTVRAGLRGFVMEAGGLAAWSLGIITAVSFYSQGGAFIRSKMLADTPFLAEALAAVALFGIVFIGVKVLGAMLDEIIERLNLGILNNALGVLFGLFEGVLVSALVIFMVSHQPLFDKTAVLNGSFFAGLLGGKVEAAANLVGMLAGRPRQGAGRV